MLSNDSFSQTLAPGTALQNGAFEVQSALGRGGFGITYTARDVRLDRDVAIKEFFPEGCARNGKAVESGTLSDSDFSAALENFQDEARVLARFQHPNIVDVYTVFPENNTAYMVMEWVRGASLEKLVEERGALSSDEAIALIEPICDALETVHGAQLIHGDITPANLMRTDNGRVVLLDFGLTRRIASQSYATVRLANTRLGTAGYAPLEQYGRQSVLGVASDIYALAATLFFLLTGEAPPEATDRAAGIALPDLRAINPAVNSNLASAINEGLAIEANARPQSARAFCESLSEARNVTPLAPLQVDVRPKPQDDDDDWQKSRPYREPQREEVDPLIDLLFGGIPGQLPVPQQPQQPRRAPQQYPQQHQRRPRQERDPFSTEPRAFIIPGCGGGCGVGCIVLLFIAFAISSFFGSLLHSIFYILGG